MYQLHLGISGGADGVDGGPDRPVPAGSYLLEWRRLHCVCAVIGIVSSQPDLNAEARSGLEDRRAVLYFRPWR